MKCCDKEVSVDIKAIKRKNFFVTKDNSIATLIKENGSGTLSRHFSTLSRHFSTLSRHKELKIVEKLCHEKRQLFRDTKFKVSNGRKDNFVATNTT